MISIRRVFSGTPNLGLEVEFVFLQSENFCLRTAYGSENKRNTELPLITRQSLLLQNVIFLLITPASLNATELCLSSMLRIRRDEQNVPGSTRTVALLLLLFMHAYLITGIPLSNHLYTSALRSHYNFI